MPKRKKADSEPNSNKPQAAINNGQEGKSPKKPKKEDDSNNLDKSLPLREETPAERMKILLSNQVSSNDPTIRSIGITMSVLPPQSSSEDFDSENSDDEYYYTADFAENLV